MSNAPRQFREDRIAQDVLFTMLDLPSCGIICDENGATENQTGIAIQCLPRHCRIWYLILFMSELK